MTPWLLTAHRGRATTAICFLVALLEGFDIQSAGVAAPKLGAALGLAPNMLGAFFAASTLGMFFGAYAGGFMADRIGRKPVVLGAVAMFGLFSILTGLSPSMPTLMASRLMTGLGLGAALPAAIALVAEDNPGRHGRAVAIMYAGMPLGGAVAGLASAAFTDWRAIFHLGGVLPLLALPIIAMGLRESRRIPAPSQVASRAPAAAPRLATAKALFGSGRRGATLTLWLAFFAAMLVLYLMLNWTPVLLSARGFPKGQIAMFQAALNVVGAIAVLVLARLVDGKRRVWLAAAAYLTTIVALALVARIPASPVLALAVGAALGGGLLTSQSLLYASAPALYDDAVRGAGVGAAVAIGRLGSICGPALAGAVLASGVSPAGLILLTIPVFLMAGIANIVVLARTAAAGDPAMSAGGG